METINIIALNRVNGDTLIAKDSFAFLFEHEPGMSTAWHYMTVVYYNSFYSEKYIALKGVRDDRYGNT